MAMVQNNLRAQRAAGNIHADGDEAPALGLVG
jgi:hypothetical protein